MILAHARRGFVEAVRRPLPRRGAGIKEHDHAEVINRPPFGGKEKRNEKRKSPLHPL